MATTGQIVPLEIPPATTNKERLKVKYPFLCSDLSLTTGSKNPKGRLKSSINFWKSIGSNETICDVIENGYRIPFLSTPPTMSAGNNSSARQQPNFVLEEIMNLLQTGRILEVEEPPHIVNPLSVAKNNDGSFRLILDLSILNKYVYKEHIKFEDWHIMEEYVKPLDFLFKFDISKGYHHVDIWEGHQTYLGFSWFIDGIQKFYIFTVLPFGITTGPFIFTKVMRCLIKHWRSLGLRIVCFLDDGLCTAQSFNIAVTAAYRVKSDLISAGFVINDKKSVWIPTQNITWLGFHFSSERYTLEVTEERCLSLLGSVHTCLKNLPYTTPRKLAKICGKIISTKLVLQNVVQLKTRRLYYAIDKGKTWDGRISMSNYPGAVSELKFWANEFRNMNIHYLAKEYKPTLLGASDASDTGIAAKITIDGVDHSICKNLSLEKSQESSTWRELYAVYHSISSLVPIIKNRKLV